MYAQAIVAALLGPSRRQQTHAPRGSRRARAAWPCAPAALCRGTREGGPRTCQDARITARGGRAGCRSSSTERHGTTVCCGETLPLNFRGYPFPSSSVVKPLRPSEATPPAAVKLQGGGIRAAAARLFKSGMTSMASTASWVPCQSGRVPHTTPMRRASCIGRPRTMAPSKVATSFLDGFVLPFAHRIVALQRSPSRRPDRHCCACGPFMIHVGRKPMYMLAGSTTLSKRRATPSA